MPRYKLTIEYDGTPFSGWQRQNDLPSVQQTVEEAIQGFAGHPVKLQCAGRTDAGVHATGQIAHADLDKNLRAEVVRDACNFYLKGSGVTMLGVELVDVSFEARFNALKRHYRYRMLDRRAPPALDATRVWHLAYPLDASAMQEAAQVLVGHHDFTTFRASECQARSAVKTLDRLDIQRVGVEIHVTASATSFLHHQVRSMVGSLRAVGRGNWTVHDMRAALEARDRARCAAVAPPHGLYLERVDYPE
jgi:tRNA pseudouridine38-40 synthase